MCFTPIVGGKSSGFKIPTRVSMEANNYLVSWLITYLGNLQPTYTGGIIHLLGAMDIPVFSNSKGIPRGCSHPNLFPFLLAVLCEQLQLFREVH